VRDYPDEYALIVSTGTRRGHRRVLHVSPPSTAAALCGGAGSLRYAPREATDDEVWRLDLCIRCATTYRQLERRRAHELVQSRLAAMDIVPAGAEVRVAARQRLLRAVFGQNPTTDGRPRVV